jgi:hypothetical protein
MVCEIRWQELRSIYDQNKRTRSNRTSEMGFCFFTKNMKNIFKNWKCFVRMDYRFMKHIIYEGEN